MIAILFMCSLVILRLDGRAAFGAVACVCGLILARRTRIVKAVVLPRRNSEAMPLFPREEPEQVATERVWL